MEYTNLKLEAKNNSLNKKTIKNLILLISKTKKADKENIDKRIIDYILNTETAIELLTKVKKEII
jgi:hypothetical protein